MDIAKLSARVSVDGAAQAKSQLDSFDKSLKSSSTSLGTFGAAAGKAALVGVAALGAAVATVSGYALNAAAGFEETISGIKSVSGATATEMAGISALALKLGADTKYSAAEAALGMEELIKGGVSVGDIMNGAANGMLNLAAAGGVDLATAAEIAANSLAMFGLKGTEMAHVADQIAGAANASSLSVTDFKFSLAAAGAIAATSGQSFDDLAEAIAIMGKSGIKGSDAGTSLKAMLMNLQPTTKAAKKQFEALGITVNGTGNKFINANGSFKSMAEISEVLQESMKGLTDAQKMQALETMFGADAMRAGAIFAKEGAEGFDAMAKSMGKVTAASVAAERMNNLRGSLEQLKGSAETAAIAFGISFMPMLKNAADGVTGMVNAALPSITAFGEAFAKWIPEALNKASQAYGLFTENLADSRGIFYGLSGAIGSVLNMFFDTDPAMLDGIASALTGIAAAASDAINEIRDGDWAGAWSVVSSALSSVWAAIDWGQAWAAVVGFADGLIARLGELTAPIEDELKRRWAAIDWTAIWAEAKAGIQAGGSFVAEGAIGNTESYTAQVRKIDWTTVGSTLGASFGAAVRSVFEVAPDGDGSSGAVTWFKRAFTAEWGRYVASAESFTAATSGFVAAFGTAFGGLEGNAMGAYIVKWCADNITKPLVDFSQGIGPFAAQWTSDFTAAFWNGLLAAGSQINVGAWADRTFLQPIRDAIASMGNITAPFRQGAESNMSVITIPGYNANGTNNWGGGLSWVGERGPELVNLPRGSQVYSANQSAQMAGASITVNIAVNGGGNAQAIGSAARDGVIQAARSIGVAI